MDTDRGGPGERVFLGVPRSVSYEPGQYKADYVAAFGKMHKLLGGKESPAIAYNGEHGAARVLLPNDAVGVLMPMRYDARPTIDNPSFLEPARGATRQPKKTRRGGVRR